MRGSGLMTAGLILLTGAAAGVAHAADEQPFSFKVCALLAEPYVGAVSYAGGDGCSWAQVAPDGLTSETEKASAYRHDPATDGVTPEQLQAHYHEMFAQSLEAWGSAAKLTPLAVCDGGERFEATVGPNTMVMGYFNCGGKFVDITTQGPQTVAHFSQLATGMEKLVR